MADIKPISTVPDDPPRHAPTGEKHEDVVAQAKDVLPGRSKVTRVEHAQINEAIAQGIAENVDDFMVPYTELTDSGDPTDAHRHLYKKQMRRTNESVE